MIIKVRLLNGPTEDVEVTQTMTIKSLKDIIHEQFNILPVNQRLVYQGRVLSDENTIESSNIREGSTLFCVESVPQSITSSSSTSSSIPSTSSRPHPSHSQFMSTTISTSTQPIEVSYTFNDGGMEGFDFSSILSTVFSSLFSGSSSLAASTNESPTSSVPTSLSPSSIASSNTVPVVTVRISDRFNYSQLQSIHRQILRTQQLFHDLRNNMVQNYSLNPEQRTILLFIMQNLSRTMIASIHPLRVFGLQINSSNPNMRRYAQEVIISLRKISYYTRLCSNILENEVGQEYNNTIPVNLNLSLPQNILSSTQLQNNLNNFIFNNQTSNPNFHQQTQQTNSSSINTQTNTSINTSTNPTPNTTTNPQRLNTPIQIPQNIYTNVLNAVVPQVLPAVQNTLNSVTNAFIDGFQSIRSSSTSPNLMSPLFSSFATIITQPDLNPIPSIPTTTNSSSSNILPIPTSLPSSSPSVSTSTSSFPSTSLSLDVD